MTSREQTSLIGIGVAIGGNVLISLALNCQKLAHKRLEDARSSTDDTTHNTFNYENNQSIRVEEQQPLISASSLDLVANYGSNPNTKPVVLTQAEQQYVVDRPFTPSEASHEEHTETTRYNSSQGHSIGGKSPVSADLNPTDSKETDYLRSKLWWWGFLLMNIGECGNFLSYAYAPASVVAPLGTVALIANCFFAPLMLKETLRKRDILGIALAIFGAVTVVGASKAKEVQLDVDGIIAAVSRHVFIIYVAVCVALTIGLVILSASHVGKRWVFVDIGLCAVFGRFEWLLSNYGNKRRVHCLINEGIEHVYQLILD
ncbi:hypothetical protein Clacol_001624 [Clathrus columnatus]|uniref:Uncharacterized protein n=1 Tax=Clathrus columnatus TaxID=1419009 RepID=A0AAV5A1W5_9AGAM|nr:hypothetical protein Clacol_001624 [Clathrus columnatus]